MLDVQKLLDQFVATTQSGAERVRHALGPDGLAGKDQPLSEMFGTMKQSMGGVADQSRDLLGGFARSVKDGNPLAIGGLAALAGAVLGGGGGAIRGAAGGGVLALLGSMAWSALKGRAAAEATTPEAFDRDAPLGLRDPRDETERREVERTSLLMLKAMINAAKADGAIDGDEKARILERIDPTDVEGRQFLEQEMDKPIDRAAIVEAVTSPEQAAEVYAASLLAITVDTPAERAYLDALASELRLPSEVVQRLHRLAGISAS